MVNEQLDFDQNKIKKLQQLRDNNVNPFGYAFEKQYTIAQILKKFKDVTHEPNPEIIKTAGRVLRIRGHGKVFFADLEDYTGKIQLFFRFNELGEDKFNFAKQNIERADIIGVVGNVFLTKRGEISIWVKDFELLTKTINYIPEKFHGLVDIDKRYRKRYLDLIMNPESREIFKKRSKIVSSIRRYLEDRDFMEVETPILQPVYGGANARPFITYHNTLKQNLFLRIAPELYLKRIVVGGFEKIFEIGHNFRNEDIDTTHNPEFTTIEIYYAYQDYNGMMELTENIISHVVKSINNGNTKIKFMDYELDFTPPFKRITMEEAVKKETGINVFKHSVSELRAMAEEQFLDDYDKPQNQRQFLVFFFEKLVEDQLIQPTFIYDFPVDNSPLAKRHRSKENFTERFELFVAGTEIANGFSELTDPLDQKARFEEQDAKRATDDEAMMNDYDFINALGYGLPPTGGVGIGIDRLVMLLTNNVSIKEVIFFPQMKSKSVATDESAKEEKETSISSKKTTAVATENSKKTSNKELVKKSKKSTKKTSKTTKKSKK
ncbi:MAG: lysine--tRNA ligase [Promethearchaeota archaeon]